MFQNDCEIIKLDWSLIDWAELLPLEMLDIIVSYLPLEVQFGYYEIGYYEILSEDCKNRLLVYLALQLHSKKLFVRPTPQILNAMKIPANFIDYKNVSLIKENGLQNVVIYSADEITIGDSFLQDYDTLVSVEFIFPNLKTIGNYWMRNCLKLQSINFTLPSLIRVGNDWMKNCDQLQSIEFTGLQSLIRVGHRWMNFCDHLQHIDFILPSLQYVGVGWMAYCKELRTVNLTRLSSLVSVGNYWMAHCKKLHSIDITGGLQSLQSVGYGWMEDCNQLHSTDIVGLSSLRRV
jgi:hypothetical protein